MTQYQTEYPQPQREKFKGLAWSAVILGIVGVVGSIIPILNNLTALVALVGLVLGVIALFGTKKIPAGIGSAVCVLAIVLTVVFQGMMVNELDKVMSGEADPAVSADAPSEVVRLGFGEEHTWSGGEAITVSQPQPYEEPNPYLSAPDGKRYVKFDVTATNKGTDEYNVIGMTITAQHDGRVSNQNYGAGDAFPNAQIPPGGSVSFSMVFEIEESSGELQVSVQPNFFAADTVYFTGQF